MHFDRMSDVTFRRLVVRALVLTSIVVAAPPVVFAQSNNERPRVTYEGGLGAAAYWDDFHVYGAAFGGSTRLYITPRIAVGPEILSVMPNESTASQLVVLGVASIDIHRGLGTPFVSIGGGMMHRYSSEYTVADPNSAALVAGFGLRLANKRATRGWYVAPEFRAVIFDDVAWHPRVNVGYRF